MRDKSGHYRLHTCVKLSKHKFKYFFKMEREGGKNTLWIIFDVSLNLLSVALMYQTTIEAC